jgi:hypothetical protein
MAADRQAAVIIRADGAQVITTYERVGASATQASERIKAATDAANSSTGRFAAGLSNAFGAASKNVANLSFQVQDAAVQLQGGANPLTVLVQQGTQVASVFGPAGAVVGAVGAGLALVTGYLFSAGDEAETATEHTYEFRDALSFLGDTATATAASIAKLTGEYRKASAESQALTRLELERQQRALEGQLEGARAAANAVVGSPLFDQFRASAAGPVIPFMSAPDPEAAAQLRDIRASLEAVDRFQAGGSLVELVSDFNQLSAQAGPEFSIVFREISDKLLGTAGNAATLEAQLQDVTAQLQALRAAGGESSQGFPVSVGPFPAPPSGSGAPRVPGSRGTRSGDAAATAADIARAARLEAAAEQRRYELVVEQINDGADAKWSADVAAAERRRDFTLQALAEEEARLKRDPAAYYRQTGDTDLASTFDPLTGASDRFRELATESQEYGRLIGEGISYGADVGARALSSLVLEGKAGIKDLAKTVTDQLVNGAFSYLINLLVGSAGNALVASFAGGTGTTGASPLTYGGPRAGGGLVRDDRWYWVGENGPERFVPDRGGSIVPAGGAGGMTVINQVVDQRQAGSPPIEQSQGRGPNGELLLRTLVRDEVTRQVASGGLDKALGARYGSKPVPRR